MIVFQIGPKKVDEMHAATGLSMDIVNWLNHNYSLVRLFMLTY